MANRIAVLHSVFPHLWSYFKLRTCDIETWNFCQSSDFLGFKEFLDGESIFERETSKLVLDKKTPQPSIFQLFFLVAYDKSIVLGQLDSLNYLKLNKNNLPLQRFESESRRRNTEG